ncbi:GNAT family N-acetyltransferase [Deinococcus malanensis]|uniref:GNAT family N-acetyltransferase n=1 Tax=Deinococcus malanensis TaxID=1706855 RepID=A0ABQ2EIH0_9DEIO|nr:GNAT family N-acetyltransferase [Deinococcus malanensis]GGK12494.1 GNAT family N-acetyltransferase [Deinococcus malanensis]
MPELVVPDWKYRSSFIEAVREAHSRASGLGDTLQLDLSGLEGNFEQFLTGLRRYEPGRPLPEGFVHSEARWLVEGQTYLGRVSLRHTLNERLRELGGHIGYKIWPSAWRQGHGTLILGLTLNRARELGLDRVLVTCDVDNHGSRGVIEANGGELEGGFQLDTYEKPIRRYWIDL